MEDLGDLIWNSAGAKKPTSGTGAAALAVGIGGSPAIGGGAHGGANPSHKFMSPANTGPASAAGVPKVLPNKGSVGGSSGLLAQQAAPSASRTTNQQNFVSSSQKPTGSIGLPAVVGSAGLSGTNRQQTPSASKINSPAPQQSSNSKIDPFGNLLDFGSTSGRCSPAGGANKQNLTLAEHRLAKEADIRRKNEEAMRGFDGLGILEVGSAPIGRSGPCTLAQNQHSPHQDFLDSTGDAGAGFTGSRPASPAVLAPQKSGRAASPATSKTSPLTGSTGGDLDAFSGLLPSSMQKDDRHNATLSQLKPLSPVGSQQHATCPIPNETQWDFDALAAPKPSYRVAVSLAPPPADDSFDMSIFDKAVEEAAAKSILPSTAGNGATTASRALPTPQAPTPTSTPAVVGDRLIAQMLEMGYDVEQAEAALAASGTQSVQAAVELIAQQNDQFGAGVRPQDSGQRHFSGDVLDDDADDMPRRKFSYKDEVGNYLEASQLGENTGSGGRGGGSSGYVSSFTTEKILSQASFIGKSVFAKATTLVKHGGTKVKAAVSEVQNQFREMDESAARRSMAANSGRPRWMTADATMANDGDNDAVSIDVGAFRDDPFQNHPSFQSPQQQRQQSVQTQASASPQQHRQQRQPRPLANPASPPRPLVACLPQALQEMEAHKAKGSEMFKLGQYGDAEQLYSLAIAALPQDHQLLIPLYANRALSRLKNGDYAACRGDATVVLEMVGTDHLRPAHEVGPGGEGVNFPDMFTKACMRRGQALEGMEKYEEALVDYREVMKFNPDERTVSGAMLRCQQALRLHTDGGSSSAAPATAAVRHPQAAQGRPDAAPQMSQQEELLAMFDSNSAARPAASSSAAGGLADAFGLETAPAGVPSVAPKYGHVTAEDIEKSERVASMRRADAKAEREEAERIGVKDQVDTRVNLWKGRKEKNIRALIASLDSVLWPELEWKPVGMHELVTPGNVKVKYMKAIGRLHPDKLTNVTVEQKLIAQGVFNALNEAWNAFKAQNGA